MKKRSRTLLTTSIVLILLSMLVAGAVQTSFGRVQMQEISLVTKVGTLTGYLLIPANATETTPAPAIVTSHGYLNNREMQDLNWVELSRRGYVVFAMNAYKHGDSSVPDPRFTDDIRVNSGGMVDAVEYLATLPFVNPDQIGVTGHSMGGGFTITTATYYTGLEREALASGASPEEASGQNKVAAALPVGSYPTDLANVTDLSGDSGLLCDLGVVAGKYDEFFAAGGNDAITILSSERTRNLLAAQTSIQAGGPLEDGKVYANPQNGYRLVIYNPTETHAQNHFSITTVGHVVDFFQQMIPAPNPRPAADQTWWLKELFNLVGLVGFFMFIVPFTDLLLNAGYFKELRAAKLKPFPALDNRARGRYIASIVLNVLLCTVLIFPLMMAGYVLMISKFWPQDTTGGIALWALGCALVGLLSLRISAGPFKGRCAEFGVAIQWRKFWKTLLLALLVVVAAFLLLFLVDYIAQTDFRFWTFDLRVFSAAKIWVAVKYLPFFLAFFIVSSILAARTTFANWSERKQTWMAVLFNILTPALFLLISFLPLLFNPYTFWGLVLGRGSMLASAGALVPILLIPFLPILGIAGYLSLQLYRLTGKIWLGALLNALLITMITVANTSFSFPY